MQKVFFFLADFFFVRSNNFIWPLTFKHSSRNNPCLYHVQMYLNLQFLTFISSPHNYNCLPGKSQLKVKIGYYVGKGGLFDIS